MTKNIILVLIAALFTVSCSLNKLVVGQMTPVLEKSADALYEESDLQLAEQALAANLKLLEGLLKNDPENEELHLLLAQGYAGYALGFVEDEDPKRAAGFYQRAFNFGVNVLTEQFYSDWQWSKENIRKLDSIIDDSEEDDLPELFWTTFALAGQINVSLSDPAALSRVPMIEKMITKIEQLDDSFFYGTVYLMKGAIAGLKPKMLGGNPEVALSSFNKNIEMTGGNFLLSYVYKARFYAAKTLDDQLFDQLISEIEQAENGPKELTLFNQIARKKAALLKSKKEDLF
ncbi:MAG: hypothetical protein KDF60_06750 [Calditrichaeota bacterium]|nr:hypothetical protein [Calditrichota bacterium]